MKKVFACMSMFLLMFAFVPMLGDEEIAEAAGSSGNGLGSPVELGKPFVIPDTVPANQPNDDMGMPIGTRQTIDAAYGVEDGINVMYTTVTGSPTAGQSASFNVVDLDNRRLLGVYPLTGTANAWTHVVSAKGKVYIGASSKVFMYNPETKTVEDLGMPIGGTGAIYSLVSDEEGNVYGGVYSTSSGGRVFKIDAETNEITDVLGKPVDDGTAPGDDGKKEDYIRSLAYYKGHLYAGTGSANGRVWKINLDTKDNTALDLPGDANDPIYNGKYNSMGFVYGMTVVDHYLFAFFNGPFAILVYDLEKQEWRDGGISNVRGLLAVTPAYDGKVYTSKKDGYMWRIDVETLEEEKAYAFDGSVRSSAWMNIKNQPNFPDTSMVTVSFDGKAVLYNPVTGKREAMEPLVEKQANNIQALEAGPNNDLYMSSYMGSLGAHYDPSAGKFTTFNLGQAEGIGFLGSTAYFGMYPKASVSALNTETPITETSTPRTLFNIGKSQDRPFVLTSGAGKLLVGTIPEYSLLGGAIAVYDPNLPGEVDVTRNVVQDQSITGLLYHNGLVYGSTSIHGGLGGEPTAQKAKLFIWDMKTKEVLHEWEPELPGTKGEMISGLTLGKDGLIYAAMDGYVFAFNPETREIVKSVNAYPEVTSYGKWRPVHQRWSNDGLLYSDVAGKLTVIDTETMQSKKLFDQIALFTIADKERIYTALGPTISRYEAVQPADLTIELPDTLEIDQSLPMAVKGTLFDWKVDLSDSAQIDISDPSIVKWEDGMLHGLKEGQVEVRATFRGVTSSAIVTVIKKQAGIQVVNGDFEQAAKDGIIPGWSKYKFQEGKSQVDLSNVQVQSGQSSMEITDSSDHANEFTAVRSSMIQINPNMQYSTKVYVYLDSPPTNEHPGKPYTISDAKVMVRYYDENGQELGATGDLEKLIREPQKRWEQVEIRSKAPAQAHYMSITLAAGEKKLAKVYFDDVTVTPINE
ncbi:ligand-binding sensor domain-containing protein [Bacillus testis]|uniref:PQQ-binding-like beta-propeller repeat protein n=1 Tax=Bacillus testis TaxID=1622072 RepID=UPI00067EDAD8|nr:PQQ-binding-like beta-propeller repeat protein [Bacillus testis]